MHYSAAEPSLRFKDPYPATGNPTKLSWSYPIPGERVTGNTAVRILYCFKELSPTAALSTHECHASH
jgi:hypothetical protein